MTFQAALLILSGGTAAAVVALLRALNPFEFLQAGALLVARANVRAAGLADADMARRLDTLPLGVGRPGDEPERLQDVLQTTLDRHDDPVPHVERLARTEPLTAARDAQHEVLKAKQVGWRRQLNPDACQLCRWWSREGKVFAPDVRMRQHPNCSCVAEPVLEGEGEVA